VLFAATAHIQAQQSSQAPAAAPAAAAAPPAQITCNQAGQFTNGDVGSQCDTLCGNLVQQPEAIFSYGFCADVSGGQKPGCFMCSKTYRIWTTVFIFVVMVGATAVILFILPICAATCHSCLTVKKDVKRRRNVEAAGGMDVAVQGKQMTVQRGAPAYNPYAYWPYYGQQ